MATRNEMATELEKRGVNVPSMWKVDKVRELYDMVMSEPPAEDQNGPFGMGGHSPRG